MDCSRFQDIMSLYIDNQLSEEEKKLFEEHISNCEQCKEELEFMQMMINNINEIDEERELPTDFHENLMAKIDNTDKKKIKANDRINKLNRFTKYYTAVAAAFVVILVFGFIGLSNINNHTDEYNNYNKFSVDSSDGTEKDVSDKALPMGQKVTYDIEIEDREISPSDIPPRTESSEDANNYMLASDEMNTTYNEDENAERADEDRSLEGLKEENNLTVTQDIEKEEGRGLEENSRMGLKDDKNMDDITRDSSKSNNKWILRIILLIGIIIVLLIPLIYIKIEKNKLKNDEKSKG